MLYLRISIFFLEKPTILYTISLALLQIKKLETEKDQYKKCFEPLKKKLQEVEESESGMRIALEKAERDTKHLKKQNTQLSAAFGKADAEAKKFESDFRLLDDKFKVCYKRLIATKFIKLFI